MKTLLITIVLLIAPLFQVLSDEVNLKGDFVPDPKRSIDWMVEAKHPAVAGEGSLEKYKNAYSGDPIIHRWMKGKLEVLITDNWNESYHREWVKQSSTSYRSVKPKDKTNTELVTTIEIESPDSYFLEIVVNGRTTREYFMRKVSGKTMEIGIGLAITEKPSHTTFLLPTS